MHGLVSTAGGLGGCPALSLGLVFSASEEARKVAREILGLEWCESIHMVVYRPVIDNHIHLNVGICVHQKSPKTGKHSDLEPDKPVTLPAQSS